MKSPEEPQAPPPSSSKPTHQPHPSLPISPPSPYQSRFPASDTANTASTSAPSPRHPISASFFNPIDPLHPSRLSTLHLAPQYTFPSSLNFLPRELETPYAFNHHTLSFHWTRCDARSDTKYNIWARPPCLNCVVACRGDEDGDLARRCDFGQRRDESFGKTRACGRCVIQGKEDKCVELIEVRHDGSVSGRELDFDTTELGGSMWSERERWLRRQGMVEWRAINLHVGDVEGKGEVLGGWERMRECTTACANNKKNWVLPGRTRLTCRRIKREVARVRAEMKRDFESAEVKESRRKRALLRVKEWDLEDTYLGIKTSGSESDSPTFQEVVDDSFEAMRTDIERIFTHIPDLEIYIADQKRFWHGRICAESVHLYNEELAQHGVEAAVEMDVEWEKAKSHVLREMEGLLDHVLRGRAEEMDGVAILGRVEKVSESTRGWLDLLVPRIWDALAPVQLDWV